MEWSNAYDCIQLLIDCAKSQMDNTNLFIITSIKGNQNNSSDYLLHSISTSYLSRQELDELLHSFRRFCHYVQIYTDIELFLKDYYACRFQIAPTMIFETSPKGIGRGKEALIPALCDIWHLRHLGPSATSNIICSSKCQWTSILRNNKIQVPDSYFFNYKHWVMSPPNGMKVILKLNYECASIGLSSDSVLVNDGTNTTNQALKLSQDYIQPVIAQEFIEGYEVEVPILVNHAFCIVLPPIGLSMGTKRYYKDDFFDYDTIYSDDYSFYDFREVSPSLAQELVACAYKIIDCLDLNGYMRIDFRVKSSGEFFVFDINNDPCISNCSSYLQSLKLLGFAPEDIAGVLIGNAIY